MAMGKGVFILVRMPGVPTSNGSQAGMMQKMTCSTMLAWLAA
jgi:hypothetical protein